MEQSLKEAFEKNAPAWYGKLKSDTRLQEMGFSFYDNDDFAKENENENITINGIYKLGRSQGFSKHNFIELGMDTNHPDKLLIGFYGNRTSFYLYTNPDYESIHKISQSYITPALALPSLESPLVMADRLKQYNTIAFKGTPKKDVTFFIGAGNWDLMTAFENEAIVNPFLHHTICMATASDNGSVTQLYTSFSGSLFTIESIQEFGTMLYYIQVEYVPVDNPFTKEYKAKFADDKFIQQFPDDAPLDILNVLLNYNSSVIETEDDLLEKIQEGDFDSALALIVMVDITKNFEKHFMKLASHPTEKFRDFVALQAMYQKNETVLNEVLKYGISDEMKVKLKNK